MARPTGYQPLPGGGYLVTRDDGSSFPTAFLPPDVRSQLDASGPIQPDPALIAAAAPGQDMRMAELSPAEQVAAARGGAANGALGRAWQGAKDFMSDVGRGMDETRAREAGKGNFSGIDATDRAAFEDAKRRGLVAPTATPATAALSAQGALSAPAGPPVADEAEPGIPGLPRAVGGGPRFAPPRIVKGGEAKVGETQQLTTYDPAAQANLKRAQQNKYEAAEQAQGAAVKGAQGNADVLGEVPGALAQMEEARQAAEARRQAAIDADHAELDKLRQETREGIHDPDEDRSVGGKIAATIALAMGAAGGAFLGRPNEVAAMFDRQTQKLIDIQKTNLANKRARYEDKRSALADNLTRFKDERQAEAATKAQYLEHAQARVQAVMADAKTDEEKARGAQVLAGIQEAAAQNEMKFGEVTHQIHTRVVPDRVVGGAMKGEADPELFVPEAGGFALRKDAVPDMNKKFAAVANIRNLLAQAKRVGSTVDQRADPAARAELQSISGQLVVALKEANQMGALDKGTQEVSGQITGDPTSLLGIGRERVIDGLSRNMQSSTRALQKAYGIVPGEVQVVEDPTTGQRKVIGVYTGEQLNRGAAPGGQSYGFKPVGGP